MQHLKPLAFARTAPFIIAILFLSNCVVPYESARMLPKGTSEVKASYSNVRFYDGADSGNLDNGLGIGVGYGITGKINVKLRYEHLSSSDGNINFLGVGPKLALKPNRIAAALPVGWYFDGDGSTWVLSPMLLFTLPNASNTFEATLGARSDLFFEVESGVLFGLNLGFGWSKNLDRWAIRPDLGVIFGFENSGANLSFGVGASYNFRAR